MTIHCTIHIHKHSLKQSSMVPYICLLELGFRIKVQCIKNKNKSKLKREELEATGQIENTCKSQTAHQVSFASSEAYKLYSTLPSHPFFCWPRGESETPSGGHNTYQHSLAKGAACFAAITAASRQVPELKLLTYKASCSQAWKPHS